MEQWAGMGGGQLVQVGEFSRFMSKLYDYTALSCLLQCEQEWDFRHRQGLARPRADVSALFGQAVHAGVRALFDGAPKEVVTDAVASAWGEFVAPEKKAHLNLSYAQAVVELYGETYGLGNTGAVENTAINREKRPVGVSNSTPQDAAVPA